MLTNSVVLLVFLIFFSFGTVKGQYASDFPSPMPMVIKSPYFNFWLPSDSNLTTPGGRWPMFYTGAVRRDPTRRVIELTNHACRMWAGVGTSELTAQGTTFKGIIRIILQQGRSKPTLLQRGLFSQSVLAPSDSTWRTLVRSRSVYWKLFWCFADCIKAHRLETTFIPFCLYGHRCLVYRLTTSLRPDIFWCIRSYVFLHPFEVERFPHNLVYRLCIFKLLKYDHMEYNAYIWELDLP